MSRFWNRVTSRRGRRNAACESHPASCTRRVARRIRGAATAGGIQLRICLRGAVRAGLGPLRQREPFPRRGRSVVVEGTLRQARRWQKRLHLSCRTNAVPAAVRRTQDRPVRSGHHGQRRGRLCRDWLASGHWPANTNARCHQRGRRSDLGRPGASTSRCRAFTVGRSCWLTSAEVW